MAISRSEAARLYDDGIAALEAGRHAEAIGALEQALAASPGDAATLYALGEAAAQLGLHQAAVRFFQETLNHAPGRHEATIRLSRALLALMRHGDAVDTLREALSRAPENAGLWLALGNAVREIGDVENAATFYREALRLNPDSVEALGNLADLVFDAGDVTEALALYDGAVRRAPELAQLRLNRALALLSKGDVEAGWRDYEYRLKIPGRIIERRGAPPRWTGGDRDGRTLLVMSEQGIGDQIAFAAFVPQLLEAGPVVLECEPRLEALLARSLPAATVKGRAVRREGVTLSASYEWTSAPLSIELGSLPHLCGGKPVHTQPWLIPDPAERARWMQWRAALGPRAVGVSWRSGLKGGLRDSQYAPLARWAQFIGKLDATIVVAQYGADPVEIATLEALSGKSLVVPPDLDQKDEIDRTCAMLSTLDAVVSAPTAVAAFSGALGVPTYKALHYRSWMSLGADREPFMPAVMCVTPPHAGQWRHVFEQMLSRLG
ncbi:MAG: tetratricopeptide repeat protein [Micropepsaceae bacterium]